MSRQMILLVLSILGAILSVFWGLTGTFSAEILQFTIPSALFAFFLMSSWSIGQYRELKLLALLFTITAAIAALFSNVFSADSHSGLLFFLLSPLILFLAGGMQLYLYTSGSIMVLAIILSIIFPPAHYILPQWLTLCLYLCSTMGIAVFAAVGNEYKSRLIQAKKELRTAVEEHRSKDGFIGGLSHHIRTSLNTVLGISEMMKSSEITDLQNEMIEAVVTGANNLLSLSDEMLKTALPNSPHIETVITEEFDIHQVVDAWIDEANRTRIEDVQFVIRANYSEYLPKGLTGNSAMITDVITGIVQAAAKKIPASSAMADIFVYDQKETASAVELLIEIHTPLVLLLKDERANLLGSESDLQDDEILNKLGLVEISESVSSKGGKLTVRHSTSNLTVIAFTALFWKNHADRHIIERIHKAVQAAEKKTGGRLAQSSILVVEDNLMNQKVVMMALRHKVAKVDIANNGKEAIQLFSNSKYDLILMDLMMPVMDGHKATAKIRELEAGSGTRTPIIALTANARAGVKELCVDSGMDDFITKPFKLDALVSKIEEYLTAI